MLCARETPQLLTMQGIILSSIFKLFLDAIAYLNMQIRCKGDISFIKKLM